MTGREGFKARDRANKPLEFLHARFVRGCMACPNPARDGRFIPAHGRGFAIASLTVNLVALIVFQSSLESIYQEENTF
ncbi:hypothetical protein QCE63_15540 [Caballeronia sp. LZ065]|uniref:hypothetical protein n=1 Tax=Caballeronia sp. LZ065 TaxID=3038571 RepID=UPI00285F70B3|nr:hypothetical protein [Caballeronia sp. LZ065]MDR5780836.1 hypothetical protein [Caballeronia sp. LZ065]